MTGFHLTLILAPFPQEAVEASIREALTVADSDFDYLSNDSLFSTNDTPSLAAIRHKNVVDELEREFCLNLRDGAEVTEGATVESLVHCFLGLARKYWVEGEVAIKTSAI